jgi:uncharacterized protein YndB with AHSA1/START domain
MIIYKPLKTNLTMSTNKVTLHRVFTAAPEKVFKAFTDADA